MASRLHAVRRPLDDTVLVDAAVFVVVLVVTGGRALRRAGGLEDHTELPVPVRPVGASR